MELLTEIENSFPVLEELFDENDSEELIDCGYSGLAIYHFGLGTWIRNHLLKESDRLYLLFVAGGISHKDDMSTLIVELFYLYMRTKYEGKLRPAGKN